MVLDCELGSSQELCIFIHSLMCKVEYPDALHNGMTNSEMEMCMCK